ncbi:MAG: histidine ammonia-lyase [Candidatus Lambdaproteobacteria bacterium RIFOXYD1_FULL_56_27]|uniref:Histidine ammonia-lyase n=1 Tax=Candidatus Lambdaproteobacteria bacterium RIFOXYD2_FULL_56_26 TaxID=1817773 RepID=A0A1F6H121_9PROT|nr:MAG: histidine ammonia-lyase [Candidatus Lambdaproteobacteria bacterium RIFOXYC1_FULL_56_13]OGH03994.1 MAG: histidine ammonia-lyase [Candidatus Lambdaproteobacteria bacterium RIFOXYD2_FULL_56_26]OGH08385.1 MAG: histidine ammonia-lyase [Candidatus Lambdaproteobacteria bacterium RIFOXYD1_FULL_56_27]
MNQKLQMLTLSDRPVPLADFLWALGNESLSVQLTGDPDYRSRIEGAAEFVAAAWREHKEIYGVTTGYGASVGRVVEPSLVEELPLHLVRFHGCGLGKDLVPKAAKAVLLARLISLAKGDSGVRWELLERLCSLYNHGVWPRIPEEGSVGASGDLTPLSYLAAVLVGEREVLYRGNLRPTAQVLQELGLAPLRLMPKEALSMMNGTSVMTALAALVWQRAEFVVRLAGKITALNVVAYLGNPAHFDPRIFAAKPHPAQGKVAARIALDLGYRPKAPLQGPKRLQDPYSLRCAPHVIGVLADGLEQFASWIEIELNSANDNPLVDVEAQEFLHGGNFYGGHIAFVMDSLKTAVANVADLLDRQMALLVDERMNHGLPANLSGAALGRETINHGLKALQIAVSAWTAEALKLTMPASVFSRSTECHNQDKVSMGTIAARDAMRILELTEQVLAGTLVAALQGVRLRRAMGQGAALTERLERFVAPLESLLPLVTEDRPLEPELRRLVALIADGALDLGPEEG